MIRDRRAILALLTALNFLNYIDRAVIAAVLKPMSDQLTLSNTEGGLLNSAFLIGYFATSPWFGARADKQARKRLIALGVGVWSLATVASGLATGFGSLLAARIVVGIGEASFAVLAPTIIDDITPATAKGKALAIFYLAIPLGSALGYILGGQVAEHWGWREAFFVAGGPGLALALLCLAIAEPARKLADAKAKLADGLREIAQIPLFRRAVFGYCVYTAAVGAFAFWAPTFLLRNFGSALTVGKANAGFGLVLIAAGAVATLVGGWLADRGVRRLPPPAPDAPYDAPEHKAAVNVMLKICAGGILLAAPLAVVCFLAPSPEAFFAIAFVVELGVFVSTSPINVAMLRAVPVERRASAMAAGIFAIHLFGDLWSAAALGLLQDALPLVVAMMALPITFAASGLVWWPRTHEATGGARAGKLPHARVQRGP